MVLFGAFDGINDGLEKELLVRGEVVCNWRDRAVFEGANDDHFRDER